MRSRSDPSRCVRCGAPAEPRQEICLQCGAQLPSEGPGGLGLRLAALPWLPPGWIWPLVVLAFVTFGSVAVALAARHERNAATPTFVATTSGFTSTAAATVAPSSPGTGFFTTASGTVPGPTIAITTLPVAPGAPSTTVRTTPRPTPTTTTKPAPEPAHGGVGVWPRGRSGWTDIVESLPESSGRGAALSVAHRAIAAGLRGVGILLSSRFSSLRAGYWVVYAGVFASSAEAQNGLATANRHGFAGAYPARVAR